MFIDYTKLKPDFINEKGTKWYIDRDIKSYMELKKINGYTAFVAININGDKDRILINNETNDIEFDTSKLEDMAVHIDILYLRGKI